jgi:hypothetical protein
MAVFKEAFSSLPRRAVHVLIDILLRILLVLYLDLGYIVRYETCQV